MKLLKRIHWWYLKTFRGHPRPAKIRLENASGELIDLPDGRFTVDEIDAYLQSLDAEATKQVADAAVRVSEALVGARVVTGTYKLPASIAIQEGDILGFRLPGGKAYPFEVVGIQMTPTGYEINLGPVEGAYK